ncbi:MAG: hypothetical protein FJ090_09580 [Deltaproteobacteria bacterium]|nr:hypothetical protein [Deltaproteobacteria bacterium]
MILAFLACSAEEKAPVEATVGALGLGRSNPFPSAELVADGKVAMVAGDLPVADGGKDWDFTLFNLRDGFSVVQPSIAMFEVPIDEDSVGGESQIGIDGSVRMVDLDSGAPIPCFAELDAADDAIASGQRTLIVRPMLAMTPGHTVAVVVTSGVSSGGAPLDLPAPEGHYADLRARLADLGYDDVSVAWDFPVGDGRALVDGVLAALPVPSAHAFSRTWTSGDDAPPPEGVWKQLEGSFTTANWLVDETRVELDSSGAAVVQGTREAYLWVTIPESVRDREPGTVPVLIFGHGIMEEPDNYLAGDDSNGVRALADELGAIVIATKWTGLTSDDRLHALEVAADFARFHEVPEMLVQGVADTRALVMYLAEGSLLDDEVFEGLADESQLHYYGISLGGIEGSVMFANQASISRGVFHVGGAAWATMLERSAQWPPFDIVASREYSDPWDRQLLYATTQVLWDPVDPAAHADRMSGRDMIWQESMGDEQVPNLTTELLMRSVGGTLATPSVTTPYELVPAAMPTTAPTLVQYDPEVGYPEPVNRPGASSGAHSIPRNWPGCIQQSAHFLATGEVANFCGEAACSASNPGSW